MKIKIAVVDNFSANASDNVRAHAQENIDIIKAQLGDKANDVEFVTVDADVDGDGIATLGEFNQKFKDMKSQNLDYVCVTTTFEYDSQYASFFKEAKTSLSALGKQSKVFICSGNKGQINDLCKAKNVTIVGSSKPGDYTSPEMYSSTGNPVVIEDPDYINTAGIPKHGTTISTARAVGDDVLAKLGVQPAVPATKSSPSTSKVKSTSSEGSSIGNTAATEPKPAAHSFVANNPQEKTNVESTPSKKAADVTPAALSSTNSIVAFFKEVWEWLYSQGLNQP